MHKESLVPNAQIRKGEMMRFAFSGRDVRVVMRQGDPWWVAVDVCAVLGFANPAQATERLDADEKTSICLADVSQGTPKRVIVSEPGLYSLILRSRKPEALAFKRWVTHEVIPTIRKTGSYGVAAKIPQTLQDALRAYANVLDESQSKDEIIREQDDFILKQGHVIRDLNRQAAEQAKTISDLRPKAEAFEVFQDAIQEASRTMRLLPTLSCGRPA